MAETGVRIPVAVLLNGLPGVGRPLSGRLPRTPSASASVCECGLYCAKTRTNTGLPAAEPAMLPVQ